MITETGSMLSACITFKETTWVDRGANEGECMFPMRRVSDQLRELGTRHMQEKVAWSASVDMVIWRYVEVAASTIQVNRR